MEQVNKIEQTENYSYWGKKGKLKLKSETGHPFLKHIYNLLISIKSQQSVYISQLLTTSNLLLHNLLRNASLSAKDT